MRVLLAFVAILVLCSLAQPAEAFTFFPPGGNLQNLPHGSYFLWGINGTLPDGYRVASASVTFHKIYNWTHEANDRIWLHLLQGASSGVTGGYDGEAYGSWFNTPAYPHEQILLNDFNNLPEGFRNRADVTYDFEDSELAMLNEYLVDGNMGLGFDPDCHFYNCGVEFSGTVAPIPEPGTLLLLGLGLVGIGGVSRRWSRRDSR